MAIRPKKEWNRSTCNPFNDMSDSEIRSHSNKCKHEVDLALPEQPYISIVKNPRVAPFAKVEFLRTPIDNLHFELYKFNEVWDDLIGGGPDYTFTVFKYNGYLPVNIFTDDNFYILRCRASNEAGYSVWSNNYELNFLLHNYNDCPGTTMTFAECGKELCCNDILVCA